MKSFIISFQQVQLIEGLAVDQPVWLYLRATLFNDNDLQTPLAMSEVGSLPPDANRMSDDSYPKGDAGLYASGLPLKAEIRNDSDNGGPRFQLTPMTVVPGQTVEVQVIMLPKVWFKEVEVPRDKLADFAKGAFLLLTAASYSGLVTLGVAAVLEGVFGGGPDKVRAPCLQTVITASHLFTYADLQAIRAEGMRRFGPADNDLSPICGLIDSFYWLSVAEYIDWPSFGPSVPIDAGPCELKPHAHFPKKSSWLEGTWSDSGDAFSSCVICTVIIGTNDRATVYITQGRPGPDNPARKFEDREIDLAIPDPPFARNLYDDACPARSVTPACPDCDRFTNLPLSFKMNKEFLALIALAPRHHGAHRLLRPQLRSARPPEKLSVTAPPAPDYPTIAENVRKVAAATRIGTVAANSRHTKVPPQSAHVTTGEHISPSLSATPLPDGRIEFTPVGTPPLHLFDHLRPIDRFKFDERHELIALVGSFRIVLGELETLYSYGEFHNKKPCCSRLRYVKKDRDGHVLADVLLMGIGPIVK